MRSPAADRADPGRRTASHKAGPPARRRDRGEDRPILHQTDTTAIPSEVRDLLDALVRGEGFELPVLPTAAREILALCQTATVDAARLSEVLHRDQALAGHVLRMANSPLYAPGVPIVSLQQAISRLGLNTLSEIAVSAAVHSRVFTGDTSPLLHDTLKRQWRHSLAAGLFAKEIARNRRHNVESTFLCGLLHDAGKPIIATALFQRSGELGFELTREVLDAAMDAFHTEIGDALAASWQLPKPVQESARHHHDYAEAPTAREAAMTTHLADHLAHFALPTGDRRVDEDAVRDLDVLEELNLYPDDVDGIIGKSDAIRDHVKVLDA